MKQEIRKIDDINTEIETLEQKLEGLRLAREKYKESLKPVDLVAILDEIPGWLDTVSAIRLIGLLHDKLSCGHKKVRGSPVSEEAKQNLTTAIVDGNYSLSRLASMFGMSQSYIHRFRRDLLRKQRQEVATPPASRAPIQAMAS